MKLSETPVLMKNEKMANLTIIRENDLFTIRKTLIVQQGVRFAEVSYNITIKSVRTTLYNIWLPIYTHEGYVTIDSLYDYCELPSPCGKKNKCEGQFARVKGYIDYGNVFDKQNYPMLPYQKFMITNYEQNKTVINFRNA